MATYAGGDIQGCCTEFRQLLELIQFDPLADRLWLVGALVNRGPDPLAVLRFVKSLGDAAISVLGNHDLHLLALAEGFGRAHKGDTLDDILAAPDRDELLDWLRRQKLAWRKGAFLMVHAGVLPDCEVGNASALIIVALKFARKRYITKTASRPP